MSEILSPYVAQKLLPTYASVLLDISDKNIKELFISVSFLCDCIEHGSETNFNQIVGQTGQKFMELIHYATKDKQNIKFELLK